MKDMIKKRAGRMLAKAVAFLCAFSISLSFAGCGITDDQTAGNRQSVFGQEADDAKEGTNEAGMGRYVEKTVFELEERGKYQNTHLQMRSDGQTEIYNDILGVYLSGDNGESWQHEENNLHTDYLDPEKYYIIASGISQEGTVALCYTPHSSDGFDPHYVLLFPDGSQKTFDMNLTEDEMYVRDFAFDESGRLFASVFGDAIYEIDTETGNVKEFVKISGHKVYLQCKNNILLCATDEKVYLYDMESDTFIEDDVLQDFIEDNYGEIDFNDGYHNVWVFLGEENVLYIAGKKGMHRHVIGGSVIEQMIDGNLSSLGDPSHGVIEAILLANQEFLVQFSDGKAVKFTYDATVPTVPENSLKVYSLRENDTIRQAVSAYQVANPDVYVKYEVGMEEGITREDALKALNTRILEGSGPDVFVLDDMPVDSYVNKGILMDISGVVKDMEKEQKYFSNLIEPFYREGSLYEVPAEFMLPFMGGDKKYLEEAKDYEGIANTLEAMRKEYPDKRLLAVYSERGIMKKFTMVCEPSWTDEKGEINQEKLKEFLYQSKRIYDTVREGVEEEIIQAYVGRDSEEIEEGIPFEDSIYFKTLSVSPYIMKEEKLMCGAVSGLYDYADLISLPKMEGNENIGMKPAKGQSQNVYMPMTMAGISEFAKDKDLAVAFLKSLLSEETQNLTHYGYPVNCKAFANKFVVDEGWVSETGAFMYYSISDAEGNQISWEIYLPDEQEMQALRDDIAQADTPYISDSVLEEAVYTAGAAYLRGDKDLDGAVKDIMDKVEIYLAE